MQHDCFGCKGWYQRSTSASNCFYVPLRGWPAVTSGVSVVNTSLTKVTQRLTGIASRRPFSFPFEAEFKLRQYQGRALPGALVIGGQKCGSTSLYNYLRQHPQIAGVVKRVEPQRRRWVKREIHYFNLDDRYRHGERWYRAHFERRREGVINFETTPGYLTSPEAPSRAHALIPEAKLIVSLRDPVARAYSAYHHMRRQNLRRSNAPQETFREYLDRKLNPSEVGRDRPTDWNILGMGMYADGLERWFALYPREQFHIVNFRDLVQSTNETVAGAVNFLGLPPAPIDTGSNANPGSYRERMDSDLEERLREYFEPHNRRLEALLGYSMGW